MQSPSKISTQFFIELERAILKFIWNNKEPRIVKTILNNKRISKGINITDLKLYYRAVVIKKLMHGVGTETGR
jgi:alanine dehydrogenase